MGERLVGIGNLFGTHGKPFILTTDTVSAFIILLTAGEGGPFNHYVFLTIVGTTFLHYTLYEFRIIYLGCVTESPFLDSAIVKPPEETGLESLGFRVDMVRFASVVGQRPATAPEMARALTSLASR